jgi:hypothetical protein
MLIKPNPHPTVNEKGKRNKKNGKLSSIFTMKDPQKIRDETREYMLAASLHIRKKMA